MFAMSARTLWMLKRRPSLVIPRMSLRSTPRRLVGACCSISCFDLYLWQVETLTEKKIEKIEKMHKEKEKEFN